MEIEYKSLPVYEQKQRILDALKDNQVIVVQSPTGSGKTTQLPVILHEAGYDSTGIIAVTQPRRIAARILGSLIPVRIFFSTRFSPEPENIFISSLNERSTLPVNTFHRKIKRRRIKIRQKKNPYRLFILIFQCR